MSKLRKVNFSSERLRQLMKAHAVTQIALSDAIGVAPSSVFYYLSGRVPKADDLYRLAKFFNVTMECFFDDEVPPEEVAEEARAKFDMEMATQRIQAFLNTHRLTTDHLFQIVVLVERLRSALNPHDPITPEVVAAAKAALRQMAVQEKAAAEAAAVLKPRRKPKS